MKHTTRAALLAALLTASAATVHAQDPVYPLTLPVSATLTDAEDKPLTGAHEVELRLYGAATGSDILWAEAFEVEGPLMAVLLGKNARPLEQKAPLKELITEGQVTHLEILIDGEVQRPRIELGAVPYAVAAEQASLALRAIEAGDAASLNGKTASDFLAATYKPTYNELQDRPAFIANAPLSVDVQGAAHTFSLAPCMVPNHTLVFNGATWGCTPLPAQLMGSRTIAIQGNVISLADDSIETRHIEGGQITTDKLAQYAVDADKIADAAVTSSKIANNAVVNDHIAANSLLPNKIVGGALTLLSNTAQTVMNTLTIAQGMVTVQGTLKANAIQLSLPAQRTYRLWADQFQPALVNSAGTMVLNESNQHYMSTSPLAAAHRATLVASVHALPGDAVLDGLTCFYTQEAGSLQGTTFKAVRTPTSGLANTRTEDTATVGIVLSNANIKTVSIGPNLNRSLYPNRLHIEVDWRPSLTGSSNKFLGCEVTIKTSDPL